MEQLIVTDRGSQTTTIVIEPGNSVMAAICSAGFPLQALCGGNCACGTCHVYVDSDWLNRLPPMSSDENDMLEASEYRKVNSRLSCQIRFGGLDGLSVTLAPEE